MKYYYLIINIQFLIIAILSLFIILNKNYGLLIKQFCVYNLIFFSLAPFYEINNNVLHWSSFLYLKPISINYFFLINLFTLLTCVTIYLNPGDNINVIKYYENNINKENLNDRIILLFLLQILLFFTCYYFYNFNYKYFFIKNYSDDILINAVPKSVYLIFEFYIRPLIFNIAIAILLYSSNKRIIVITLLIAIITNFPSSINRFSFASLYGTYLFIYILKFFGKINVNIISLCTIFGFISIFPILEVFRYKENLLNLNIFSLFESGHLDNYQMLSLAIEYSRNHLSYGYGLLGALFFFIPRSIWPDKPITSGFVISNYFGLHHDNVSMPLLGELILNYSNLGILVYIIFIYLLIYRADSLIIKKLSDNYESFKFYIIIYIQLGILLIYLLRGGILSSFAYTIASVFSLLTVKLILKK
jgi:hypothetical protein